MGTLFGFVVGYVLGARAGSQRFDEVVRAVGDVRRSDEFTSLLRIVRHHVVGTLRLVSDRLAGDTDGDGGGRADVGDLLARARARAEHDDAD